MRSNQCPKCQGSMVEGFTIDHGHSNARQVSSWIEGPPQKSFWLGLKISGRRKLAIKTFRCERCGFLENYAND
jgi:hypothetical protein